MGRRKKRSWSDEEKREICQQTVVAGVSVAQVARRYAVNANLIFKWLKDSRFAPVVEGCDDKTEAGGFLPVEIEGSSTVAIDADTPRPAVLAGAPLCANRVDITLSDGRRVLIEGPTALSAVLGLVQGLMA
jgi:transposase